MILFNSDHKEQKDKVTYKHTYVGISYIYYVIDKVSCYNKIKGIENEIWNL